MHAFHENICRSSSCPRLDNYMFKVSSSLRMKIALLSSLYSIMLLLSKIEYYFVKKCHLAFDEVFARICILRCTKAHQPDFSQC